jgi:hypothetical protein
MSRIIFGELLTDRLMRVRIPGSFLLVLAAGCAELPSEPAPLVATPILLTPGNPPPPPVVADPADPPACVPDSGCTPYPAQVPVGARYLRNPSGTFASVTFFTSDPGTSISANAWVRDGSQGLIGQGRIVATISTCPLSKARSSTARAPAPGNSCSRPRPGTSTPDCWCRAECFSGTATERSAFLVRLLSEEWLSAY